jgi:hypothetical protein
MHDQRDSGGGEPRDPGWGAFYHYTLGREPRPLFVRGMQILRDSGAAPGQAVEVGFGDGEETLALLSAGWRVVAIDSAPEARDVLRPRVPPELVDHLQIRSSPAQDTALPRFDLLYAGYSLPFLGPEAFDRFLAHALERANPGGHLVINLFGTHDTWADRPGMRFHKRSDVEGLLAGLDVLLLDEIEEDGMSFLGPKHWHTFDIVARRRAG